MRVQHRILLDDVVPLDGMDGRALNYSDDWRQAE